MINEINIMKKVGIHKNILRLHEAYETENSVYLILDIV